MALRLLRLIALVAGAAGVSLFVAPPFVWLALAPLAIVAGLGTNDVTRAWVGVELAEVVPSWLLPSLLAVAAALLLRLIAGEHPWLALTGVALFAVAFGALVVVQCVSLDPNDPRSPDARAAIDVIAYLVAFAAFSAIYGLRLRSAISATAVSVIAGLLMAEVLRPKEVDKQRLWRYAGVVGLCVGELAWALNYWPIGGLLGGVYLLLAFYLFAGLAQHHLAGTLDRKILGEYGGIAALGFAVILGASYWIAPR
ncbi:MAG: hypothetical protein HY329_08665 [Chloroflexi bacterium]|nr:hypothetical protein [Chloroflexota bacterium]